MYLQKMQITIQNNEVHVPSTLKRLLNATV